MPLDLADIRALVNTGEFPQLIGEVEGQHLDAKSQPYLFTSGNDAKGELAKDVLEAVVLPRCRRSRGNLRGRYGPGWTDGSRPLRIPRTDG